MIFICFPLSYLVPFWFHGLQRGDVSRINDHKHQLEGVTSNQSHQDGIERRSGLFHGADDNN